MRTCVLAVAAVAAAVFAIPATPAFSQVDVEVGRHGVRVWAPSRCREMRAACMHKREMGEQGMGNCRAYREHCR
jgi:hypothetical protein